MLNATTAAATKTAATAAWSAATASVPWRTMATCQVALQYRSVHRHKVGIVARLRIR